MQWQEIKVVVDRCGADAVTSVFYDLGSGGVVMEDPLAAKEYIEGNLWDYYDLPEMLPEIQEGDRVLIKAYLPEDNRLVARLEEMQLAFQVLKTAHLPGCHLEVKLDHVADEDWANSWKAFYKPEKVGERVVIKPTWESYQALSEDVIIELDPGMAFGTGTHPTTVMCLQALEKTIQGGELIYDVGCGSGVLGIAAAKLGAGSVLAVDLDNTAVDVAQKNVELNGVDASVKVELGNLLDTAKAQADIVVANIIADIIIMVIPDVASKLKPGGVFISSGIIDNRAAEVKSALQKAGFTDINAQTMDVWVAFTAKRGA